jgi:Na+-transporting NADH:ubiquinone oxidoreductase subunit B
MAFKGFQLPEKLFVMQKPHIRVCQALLPLVIASIYLFGWRSLALVAITFPFGILTEAIFTFRQGKPVTSAVFVTCLIFILSLPPTIPFWMVIVGIVVGVGLGKMAFGGFGQNIFNPAMVGRCFLYITFPIEMTNRWISPARGGLAGFAHWSSPVDAVTRATPLVKLRSGESFPLEALFLGTIPGSLGETSALLILLGGIYILYRKAASWRLVVSCLVGAIVTSGTLHLVGFQAIAPPISNLLAGSFLFGAIFVVTEPISGAKTKEGQWIYGFIIGALTVVLRGFSNFSCGLMFSVLIMNAFVPILDQTVRQLKASRRVSQ